MCVCQCVRTQRHQFDQYDGAVRHSTTRGPRCVYETGSSRFIFNMHLCLFCDEGAFLSAAALLPYSIIIMLHAHRDLIM